MHFIGEQGAIRPPLAENEPIKNYAPGSEERRSLISVLERMSSERVDIPLIIGGRDYRTRMTQACVMPHRHSQVLADMHLAARADVIRAIAAAKTAWPEWSGMHWSQRAGIFLRAAEMLAGPWRDTLNAATMLGQSKTVHQAEIDSAAELIDFWRFNTQMMQDVYADQPISTKAAWNRTDYRPLEGFVYAVTPFNFTSIAGNLPTAPALLGNTVVWKPSAYAALSAHYIMDLLKKAGLPDGVINLVNGDPSAVSHVVLSDPDFAGLHFTGSTDVFNGLWQKIAGRIGEYRGYPRLVGETGGKNFIVAHASADVECLATAIIRGGFEYQGQKCSAASRVFIADNLWPKLRERLCDEVATIKVGDIAEFGNFMGAVINEGAWNKHTSAIEKARGAASTRIVAGGMTSKKDGYFVHPTIIETEDLRSELLKQELFGPIVTVNIYPEMSFHEILGAVDTQCRYGLTGAVFATDRIAIHQAMDALRYSAGNFYINDKPTGAVVGQQPFGGARASGTNDKAGSMWNLIRWLSPRSIKETFLPPHNYRYPYMG